jgi:hypothetical protein
MDDKFRIYSTCSKGHKTLTLLQEERFELLFDLGCEALLNGDYRGSVLNIAAAVERYHEFFIKVIMLSNGIIENDLDEIWKFVKSQSERQLGAFYIIYRMQLKMQPNGFIKDTHNNEVRNDVVHKGKFSTMEDTNRYDKAAYEYIIEGLRILRKDYSESIQKLREHNLHNAIPQGNKCVVATMSSPSIIGLTSGEKDWGTKSFEEVLSEFKQRIEVKKKITEVSKYAKYLEVLFSKVNRSE